MGTDTIFAVSSGLPPAAIAVLRISGREAPAALQTLAGGLPPARRASMRRLSDPADGSVIDHAVVIHFPGPNTVTGEDVVELHLHGSRAVIAAASRALAGLGLRQAEPGEFTRRALMAARIDLTEAEALGDLLAAETEGQRRAALRNVGGMLRRQIEAWSTRLTLIAAQVEAAIDYADEADVAETEAQLADALADALGQLAGEMARLAEAPPVDRIRDGIRVVLAGPPNAGKSTLLNLLAGREAAIVSPLAGTTRDRIEVPVMRGGLAYLLTDTAGLRADAADMVEQAGIALADAAVRDADILLWLGDDAPPRDDAILFHARADLLDRQSVPAGRLPVSSNDPDSIDALWNAIDAFARSLVPGEGEAVINSRQRALVARAADALKNASHSDDAVLCAEDIRQAMRALDQITGRTDVEAVLDALFARFCIGK